HDPAATLPGIESVPRRVVARRVKKGENGRHRSPQRLVQGEELACDLLSDGASVVTCVDPKVALAEIDDRQIGAGCTVRDGARLEDKPILRSMRGHELPEQALLANPGLAHNRHELPMTPTRLLEGLAQVVELALTSDEPGETAGRRRLKARARRRLCRQLEHLDQPAHPLDWQQPDRYDLDESLGQTKRIAGQPRRSRSRELLHARGQVCGLADRGVVHPEITADGAHDNLSGVEAHTDLDLDAMGPTNLDCVAVDGLLHRESRVARSPGVILVRDGAPE